MIRGTLGRFVGLGMLGLWGLSQAAPPPAGQGKLIIDAIDVEGGAATLYITPEHQSLLIDTGWPAVRLHAGRPGDVRRRCRAGR